MAKTKQHYIFIPKAAIKKGNFGGITCELSRRAVVLFFVILDWMQLDCTMGKQCQDEESGQLFVQCSNRHVRSIFGVTRNTARKIINELAASGLIRISLVNGEASRIYIDRFEEILAWSKKEQFYAFPKSLLNNPEYSEVPFDAKLLYVILRDFYGLSKKSGSRYRDAHGYYFVQLVYQKIKDLFHIENEKISNLLKKLTSFGLIARTRYNPSGKRSEVHIYVREPHLRSEYSPSADLQEAPSRECGGTSVPAKTNSVKNSSSQEVSSPASTPTYVPAAPVPVTDSVPAPVSESAPASEPEYAPAPVTDSVPAPVPESAPATEPEYAPAPQRKSPRPSRSKHSAAPKKKKNVLKSERYEQAVALVRKQIDAEALCEGYFENSPTHDAELVDSIVRVIAEVYVSPRESYHINKIDVDRELVIKRLRQIDYDVADVALTSLEQNKTEIRNINAYVLTLLFNAPVSTAVRVQNKFSSTPSAWERQQQREEEEERQQNEEFFRSLIFNA